jgi:hypothetical protein
MVPAAPDGALDSSCTIGENVPLSRGEMHAGSCGVDFDKPYMDAPAYLAQVHFGGTSMLPVRGSCHLSNI